MIELNHYWKHLLRQNNYLYANDFYSKLFKAKNFTKYDSSKNVTKPRIKRPDVVLSKKERKTQCDYCEKNDHNVSSCSKIKSYDLDTMEWKPWMEDSYLLNRTMTIRVSLHKIFQLHLRCRFDSRAFILQYLYQRYL